MRHSRSEVRNTSAHHLSPPTHIVLQVMWCGKASGHPGKLFDLPLGRSPAQAQPGVLGAIRAFLFPRSCCCDSAEVEHTDQAAAAGWPCAGPEVSSHIPSPLGLRLFSSFSPGSFCPTTLNNNFIKSLEPCWTLSFLH